MTFFLGFDFHFDFAFDFSGFDFDVLFVFHFSCATLFDRISMLSWAKATLAGSGEPAYVFASVAAALNRVREGGSEARAAAEELAVRSRHAGQREALGRGLHILAAAGNSADPGVARASLEALAGALEGEETEENETAYAVLLNREQLAQDEALVAGLVAGLRDTDLWRRFWTLRVLLALARDAHRLGAVREAVLAAPEGPRLVAETVQDSREAVRQLGVDLLALVARNCYPVAQLAAYGGALEDLLKAVHLGGGLEGVGAAQTLRALGALLEGHGANQSQLLLVGGAQQLSELLELEASDLVVLTDAKAAGLGAACELIAQWAGGTAREQVVTALWKSGAGERVALVALGRLPGAEVRARALGALGILLDNEKRLSEQQVRRAAEVAVGADGAEAALAAWVAARAGAGEQCSFLSSSLSSEKESGLDILWRAVDEQGSDERAQLRQWHACHVLAHGREPISAEREEALLARDCSWTSRLARLRLLTARFHNPFFSFWLVSIIHFILF